MYSTGYVHAPLPRRRQPSSTSSTLLTPSEGSEYMPRASTSTSRSIFSDGGHEGAKDTEGDEMTEVGTVNMDMVKVRDERPLIDFGDEPPRIPEREEEGPTPGDKLRMLLRQMEAEVRNTTQAPTPMPTRRLSFQHQTPLSEEEDTMEEEEDVTPAPVKSHWREGRRIGALPKERSYSPIPSPERRRSSSNQERNQDGGEEEEISDDSPPTPPLRIANPYLHNNKRVSEGRRSVSPRISSRAAVLHASTSKSPDPPVPTPRSHLENYLARAPSPSRKGKERATPSPIRTINKGKTPRKWSVEIAPDDSVLFAEGIPEEGHGSVELDVDESVEPPWDETDQESPEMELPELPEVGASYEESSEEEVLPATRPESRMRSRFSHSLSSTQSRTQIQQRSPGKSSPSTSRSVNRSLDQSDSHSRSINESKSFTTARTTSLNRSRPVPPDIENQSASTSNSHSHSRLINDQSTSFKTARTNSLNRSTRPVPPPQPVFPQEIQVGMAFTPSPPPRPVVTPPRANLSIPGQTPKPPGAWLSTSKPTSTSRGVKFTPSPSPLRDTSIHRIKLSPRRSPNTNTDTSKEEEEEGDISITQRLLSLTKNLSFTKNKNIPKPSTTLSEARESLMKAAEASAVAQRRVEASQRLWLEAIDVGEVVKRGWSWGRWGWWISMEILLLWGVFRVTLEYAQISTSRPFDTPSYALSLPLPTAISAFVIPNTNRRSANFFDLLEGLEVWRVFGSGEELRRIPI